MKPNYTNYTEATHDRDLMKDLNDQCNTMMDNVKSATLHSASYITNGSQHPNFIFDVCDDKNKLGSVIFEGENYGNMQAVVFCDKDNNVLKVERDFDKFNEYFKQMKSICEPAQLKDIDLVMNSFRRGECNPLGDFVYEGKFGNFVSEVRNTTVILDEEQIRLDYQERAYATTGFSESSYEKYLDHVYDDVYENPDKYKDYIIGFEFSENELPEGYDPDGNYGKDAIYTFEHKASPDDKIGYSVAVGSLTESARVFGEFENQETIEGRDWTTCKWHKNLNAAEEYIKSRSDDYNKMLDEKRITFTKDIDTDAAMSKGWVSVEMREGYGPQNVRYMNFSNGTANFNDPGDYITKKVADDHGKFVKNTNLMVEAHDFAGHPDGDILHVTALEDKTIEYRNDKGKYFGIIVHKGDEMYVGGETVLDKPVSDFHAILQEKIKANANDAKDVSNQRQNITRKPGE